MKGIILHGGYGTKLRPLTHMRAQELSKHPPTIPWLKKVEKVTVTEA